MSFFPWQGYFCLKRCHDHWIHYSLNKEPFDLLNNVAVPMDYFVALLKVAAFFTQAGSSWSLPRLPTPTTASNWAKPWPAAPRTSRWDRRSFMTTTTSKSWRPPKWWACSCSDFVQTLSLELILTEIKMAAVTWETYWQADDCNMIISCRMLGLWLIKILHFLII